MNNAISRPTLAQPAHLDKFRNADLDELLACWHAWQKADRGVKGFPSKALMIGDTRAMRVQYEAQIERQDDEHDNFKCRQVNHEVGQMNDPYRAAIYIDARNLCSGLAVWDSPKLPALPEHREQVLREARMMLTKRLISAGVM